MDRHVFFISDGTGITAENLGLSLISQFDNIDFTLNTLPYIDSVEKAERALEQIAEIHQTQGAKPVVFITLINQEIKQIINQAPAIIVDLFDTFIPPLEAEFGTKASGKTGQAHGVHDNEQYHARIEAINYTLSTDDGLNPKDYNKADIILVGVSRSGKTPTSIYLALHYGICAANYPITMDDLEEDHLPKRLEGFTDKCFGLTIDPTHLAQIRHQRLENSEYASLKRCTKEVKATEGLFQHARIPYLNTTHLSVEEIATRIVSEKSLGRKII